MDKPKENLGNPEEVRVEAQNLDQKKAQPEVADVIAEKLENNPKEEESHIEEIRENINVSDFPQPITVSNETKELIEKETEEALGILKRGCQTESRGYYASADTRSQFYGEVWSRDASLVVTAMVKNNPKAVLETLKSLFRFEKEDGTFPVRVEYVRHWANYIPILRSLKKLGFASRKEAHPVYESRSFALPARDSVPSIIIACGEFFRASEEGKAFIKENWTKIKVALKREERFADKDGLVRGESLQDWADSIKRTGKLSYVNTLYFRSLREMSFMAKTLGHEEEAEEYGEQARKVKESFIKTFWNEEEGYVRAGEGDDRIDTPANIFATLYLVDSNKGERIEESLKKKVTTPSGLLKNFDPPYSDSMIAILHKIADIKGYHNDYLWPWVTCYNILAKLKLAETHSNEATRERFRKEAVSDFASVARVMKEQGFYEVLDPKTTKPIHKSLFGVTLYKSSSDFAGSAASFVMVRERLKALGAIQ